MSSLFPTNGTLTATGIRTLIDKGHITSDAGIASDLIQPASLDLTLSSDIWRLPGSTLPIAGEDIRTLIDGLAVEHIVASKPTVLARGHVYIVRLRERFSLPIGIEAYTNSKSSTGRVDLATRVLTNATPRYDRINSGYDGDVWLELIPRSFDVIVQSGISLNQAIFFHNRRVVDASQLSIEHAHTPLLLNPDNSSVSAERCIFDNRLVMGADLSSDIVGFVAKRCHKPVHLGQKGSHNAHDYFTPVTRPESGYLFLEKGSFYILSTYEKVAVPDRFACEMVPYDPSAGEFRAHYAGFFDPGWGVFSGKQNGARAVLEVRPHEDDLILRHQQPICAMVYEELTEACTNLYGDQGNHYAHQNGPRLSKHFSVDS